MNFGKPIHITLLGSSVVWVLVFILLLLFDQIGSLDLGPFSLILIPLLVAGSVFILFTYLIARFINKKIKFIYGIINSKQIPDETESTLKEDVIGKLTVETAEWAAVQKKQIHQLKKQAAFRKEFLGNLAHELKTPVFSIQGYILTLLEGGLEDERVNRDFLERALAGVDRISNLLEDLDEISRLETDRFELKIKKFDLVSVIKEVFNELETKANNKQIKLSFDRHYEPLYVSADQSKITQVVVNLISNSISYGINGGTTKVKLITIDRKKLMVEVTDNGVGMDSQHIPRLFERFYRVDKSRERNIGGSGLGLAIVKHIVEAHQQTINVRSTEGVGSTFAFTLEKV